MTSVGETLRRERERRNLDLEQISRELKISSKLLKAIEDENFEKLPGVVFAKSFCRQYARLLGLDEEEIAGELQRTLEPSLTAAPHLAEPPKPVVPELQLPRLEKWESARDSRSSRSSSLPALALVVVVMLVCSGVYTWWQRERRSASARDLIARQSPPAPVPVPSPVLPPATQPFTPPQGAAPQAAAAGAPQPSGGAGPAPASASPPAPTAAAASPENPAQPYNPEAPVRVQFTATDQVWVRADADGKLVVSRTLNPNDTRNVSANEEVVLRLGNAGGLDVTLNGKPLGPVGPKGQVRTVQFTSGGFKILSAPKPATAVDPF